MLSEVLLDLFPFTGTENIVEIYEDKPVFEEACLKRGGAYQSITIEHLNSIEEVDLFIFIATPFNLKNISVFLNQKKDFSFYFILIAKNKYSFHKICAYFEGTYLASRNDVTLSLLEKSLSFIGKMKKYQVFHSLENPTDIRKINTQHENYLIARSSRTNNKRTFRKTLSVLFEIIFMRHCQLPSLAPAYVFIGERKK